jgi:hypothetical protein
LPMYLFRKKRTDLRLSAFGYQQFGLGFEWCCSLFRTSWYICFPFKIVIRKSSFSIDVLMLISFDFLETGSHYVAHSGLELPTLLPQSPECWDYRCEPPHPAVYHYTQLYLCICK